MCNLAATGVDGLTAAILCAAALVAVVAGVALMRGARAGAAIVLIALVVAVGVISAPAPAQAACPPAGAPAAPPAPPPVDPATIVLIVSDVEFRAAGARTLTVDVINTSVSAVAFAVNLVGAPPVGVSVDASACATIAPGGSCSIVVEVSALAGPFFWTYNVAGSNTNAIADSIHAWETTTLALTPPTGSFVIPGDANTFTVQNTGAVEARFMFPGFSGSDPGAYSVNSTTCTGALVAGASCTMVVAMGIPLGDGTATLEVHALNADTVTASLTN